MLRPLHSYQYTNLDTSVLVQQTAPISVLNIQTLFIFFTLWFVHFVISFILYSLALHDLLHSIIFSELDQIICSLKLSLPPDSHGVTVDQCPTPAVHVDDSFVDDFCDVSASLHPASVVQSQHREPLSHAAVHDWRHCLPAGHNATFRNMICFPDKQFLIHNITKAKRNTSFSAAQPITGNCINQCKNNNKKCLYNIF